MIKVFAQRVMWVAMVFVLMTLGTGRAWGQVPMWDWATSPGNGYGFRTTLDVAGNVYVTGGFFGTVTFGTTTLTSAGGGDAFVAKLSSSGSYQWAVRAGGAQGEAGRGIAVDAAGNVYVCGEFGSSTATFGSTILSNSNVGIGGSDAWIAKINSAGVWQWALGAGNSLGSDNANAVALDAGGNIYVVGSYPNTITLGTTTLPNTRAIGQIGQNIFVTKLDPAGTYQWAINSNAPREVSGINLALLSTGQIYVTGFYNAAPAFGTISLPAPAGATGYDTFVARLSPAGAWQTVTTAWGTPTTFGGGGGGVNAGFGIAVDANDNAYVTGTFNNPSLHIGATMLLNSGPVGSRLNNNIFIAKLESTGRWQWATSGGGSRFGAMGDIAVDGNSHCYVTGWFSDSTVRFGTITLANTSPTTFDENMFLAEVDDTGAWQWAVSSNVTGRARGQGVTIDSGGNGVLTGSYSGAPINFGTTTLPMVSNGMFISHFRGTTTGLPAFPIFPTFTLHPNPAHHTATLTGAPAPETTATLLDALGRTVRTVALTAGAATIDLRGLAPGLYTVRTGALARRLVVE